MKNTGKTIVLVVGLLFALMTTLAVAASVPTAPAPAQAVVQTVQDTSSLMGQPVGDRFFASQDGKRFEDLTGRDRHRDRDRERKFFRRFFR